MLQLLQSYINMEHIVPVKNEKLCIIIIALQFQFFSLSNDALTFKCAL